MRRPHSEATKQKIAAKARGNQRFLGRRHSPEAKQRMSEAKKAAAQARFEASGQCVIPRVDRKGAEPGWCVCGCGGRTNRITRSDYRRGYVVGEYFPFLKGHANFVDLDKMYEIDPATGCWNWTGYLDPKGYGRLGSIPAYWILYARAKGPIARGLTHDHVCRNRRCVNPDHIEPVTGAENTRRGFAARRREQFARAS